MFLKNFKKSSKINFFQQKNWQILVFLHRAEMKMRKKILTSLARKIYLWKQLAFMKKLLKKNIGKICFRMFLFFTFFRKKQKKIMIFFGFLTFSNSDGAMKHQYFFYNVFTRSRIIYKLLLYQKAKKKKMRKLVKISI